jgi:hypothetical protein
LIIWTAELDAAIQQQRRQGANWQEVANHVGVEVKTVMKRARALGIPTDRINVGQISGKDVIAGRRPNRKRSHRTKPRSTRWEAIAPGRSA